MSTNLPLVLLPGWGLPASLLRPLATSRQVIAIDLWQDAPRASRPAAGSRGPAARSRTFLFARRRAPASPQAWLARIAAALPERCDLLGWSLGAQLAMAIALAWPQRVRRLVLVAATPCFLRRRGWRAAMAATEFGGFRQRLSSDAAATIRQFQALVAQGDQQDRRVLRTLRAAAGDAPDAVALAAGLDWLQQTDLRDAVSGIDAPTLLLAGSEDRVVPAAASRWLARRLAAATLAEIPGAAHAPFLSDAPRSAAAVAGFLEAA